MVSVFGFWGWSGKLFSLLLAFCSPLGPSGHSLQAAVCRREARGGRGARRAEAGPFPAHSHLGMDAAALRKAAGRRQRRVVLSPWVTVSPAGGGPLSGRARCPNTLEAVDGQKAPILKGFQIQTEHVWLLTKLNYPRPKDLPLPGKTKLQPQIK